MIKDERRDEIYKYIKENEVATIEELVTITNVSSMTIRRDINHLEEKDLITKIQGGAIIRSTHEFTFEERANINYDKKLEIAQIAAQYIKPGDTIMLDGSSTSYVLSDYLPENIVVVTNNIPLALNIVHKANIEIVIIGGNLRKDSGTINGAHAVKNIEQFHVDKVFLSAYSLDLNYGATDKNMEEAAVKLKMLEMARENFFMIDSSKLNKRHFYRVCDVKIIDNIIMDTLTDEEKIDKAREHCEKNNINLITK